MSPPALSMDEQKPPASSDSGSQGSVEARFADFCKRFDVIQSGLSLAENTYTEAMKLFSESKHLLSTNVSAIGTGTSEEAERYWFAFVLYSVRRLSESNTDDSSQGNGQNEFTLCQILRLAKLNIVDFFKELPQFIIKSGPILSNQYGADWEKRLQAKELQANFVHLSLLSKGAASAMLMLLGFALALVMKDIKAEQRAGPGAGARYYKRAFREFFLTSDSKVGEQSADANATGYVSDYHRFGWLLFLALRSHAFSRFKDLVTCTNGLVAILAILIIHVPVRLRNFTINDSARFVKKGSKGVDLLASLCNSYETSEDELRKTLEKANGLIADILKKKPCPASQCVTENLENIHTDDLIYFEDLMEEASLSASLDILEKDYADATRNKCELDERVFINEEDSLLASGSLSGGAMNISGAKRKIDSITSPAKTITSALSHYGSPSASQPNGIPCNSNSKPAATPVTTAMTTAKWLRTVISPLPPKPSLELERYLSSCDRDVTSDVTRRANIILEAIFPSNGLGDRGVTVSLQCTSLMDSIWTKQRRLEALKLYYRVLQAMCTAEAQILQASNLTSLLTNERFHRCMLACSAELVLATHKTVTMLFPAVLERTGITAFDLSKVIESFIRHEESLPRELRRHLNSLEERLLESMVWEKGSSMYNSLTIARPALSSEINRLGLLAEPMPSLDAIALHMNISCGSLPCVPSLQKSENSTGQNGDMRSPKRLCTEYRSLLVERNPFTSPVKDRFLVLNNLKSKLPPPALQSAFASPTRPNPVAGGETCAETAINIFFSKVLTPCFCSFYSIHGGKGSEGTFIKHMISQLNLTFREIIVNYRKQPHCKPQVFRSVFVDWSSARHHGKTGQEHLDIIAFYNEIFIPAVKPLLVEVAPVGTSHKANRNADVNNNTDGQCPGSPKVSSFPSLPDMSPKKVSAVHNVYVSPLRSSKMDALISNSSKSYYACVGESTHAYQSPSKDLTAINNRLNGNRKLRGTLNFDDVDVGLVSDSLVANSLYLQNGSCASSSGAPVKSEQLDS
ncbi:hypothetical protein C3L33_13283, partial [Rhododendron williamsianum]